MKVTGTFVTCASNFTNGGRFEKMMPASARPSSSAIRASSGVGGNGDSEANKLQTRKNRSPGIPAGIFDFIPSVSVPI